MFSRDVDIPPRNVLLGSLLVLWVLCGGFVPAWAQEIEATAVARLGPAPRTPSGLFENTIGTLTHGDFSTRFPFFLRRLAGLFRTPPDIPRRRPNDGAWLRSNARGRTPTITWIGHSTMLVQMDGLSFLTDPIWSETPSPIAPLGPKRFVAPGVAIADLPPIDFVVVSHNHYDHLDLPTLRTLADRESQTRFLVPLGNADLLREHEIERVDEFDWGESITIGEATIYCLPTQHWSKRGLSDDHEALWASWAVVGNQRRFYFAGDTGFFEGFARIGAALGPFDLAALPIGAYAPRQMMQPSHVNPEEAIRAARDLRADTAIAMHFGTFDLSDEPLGEPPRRFRKAALVEFATVSAPEANPTSPPDSTPEAWVFEIGETRPF